MVPLMDLTLITDAARAMHFIGLSLGLGAAAIADFGALRTVITPLEEQDLDALHFLHRIVSLGLALLWISGLVILYIRTGFDPSNFSPKLMSKLAVVLVLTFNAMMIGRALMPMLIRYEGRLFGQIPFHHRVGMALVGGLSFASWASALALGVFSHMKTMSWDTLEPILSTIFALGIGGALVISVLAPVIAWTDRMRVARAA